MSVVTATELEARHAAPAADCLSKGKPIEFNAAGGALPDCSLYTHHYCPGDNPLKMALRSILRSCVWCPDRWSR